MDRDRRRLLGAAGLAIASALTGCTDQQEPEDAAADTDTPTGTAASTTERGTAAETETGTPTASEPATATPGEPLTPTETVALTIDNVDLSAWAVTADESGQVAETGTENPTMTFETGVRYVVENDGWSFHPFALRASDDTPLLSQAAEGRYESDRDVDWVDNGSDFAFTVTEGLAADLAYYICTVHPSMRGDATGQ